MNIDNGIVIEIRDVAYENIPMLAYAFLDSEQMLNPKAIVVRFSTPGEPDGETEKIDELTRTDRLPMDELTKLYLERDVAFLCYGNFCDRPVYFYLGCIQTMEDEGVKALILEAGDDETSRKFVMTVIAELVSYYMERTGKLLFGEE